VLCFLLASTTVAAGEWAKVRGEKLYSISGMALLAQKEDRIEFLVVHDSKSKGEPKLGLVMVQSGTGKYFPLTWPSEGEPPVDLESISSVPDQHGQFLALASNGRLFSLTVAEKEGEFIVAVRGDFQLPELPPDVNIEGISVQKLGSQPVIAWGHRGAGRQPGLLYWGVLDLDHLRVNDVSKATVSVPFPSPSDSNTRHIADLKIDSNGAVWISSTNDPGDDGPFVSAIYTIGALHVSKSEGTTFESNIALTRLWIFLKKVEAIEFVPGPQGAVAFGTDDENDGGWLYFQ
jgi:hypothetical protein